MYRAAFRTETPLGHVPRALDELARIDCVLQALRVTPCGGQSLVELCFQPSPKVSTETLMARLARIPGVEGLQGGAAIRAEAA